MRGGTWVHSIAMKTFKRWWAAIGLAVLAGCGGGNSGAPTPATVSSFNPEGLWSGFTTGGLAFNMAILENGDTWALYYSGPNILGVLQGKATWTTNTFSGTGTEFILPARSVVESRYSGSYTRKATLQLQTSGGVAVTTSFSPAYDQPTNLAEMAGVYNGQGQTVRSALTAQPLTITSTGSISGGITDCSISGVLLPRSPSKGVFNVFISRDGLKCPLGSTGSFQGVAIYDATARRLITISLNADKDDGFFYVGTRN